MKIIYFIVLFLCVSCTKYDCYYTENQDDSILLKLNRKKNTFKYSKSNNYSFGTYKAFNNDSIVLYANAGEDVILNITEQNSKNISQDSIYINIEKKLNSSFGNYLCLDNSRMFELTDSLIVFKKNTITTISLINTNYNFKSQDYKISTTNFNLIRFNSDKDYSDSHYVSLVPNCDLKNEFPYKENYEKYVLDQFIIKTCITTNSLKIKSSNVLEDYYMVCDKRKCFYQYQKLKWFEKIFGKPLNFKYKWEYSNGTLQ